MNWAVQSNGKTTNYNLHTLLPGLIFSLASREPTRDQLAITEGLVASCMQTNVDMTAEQFLQLGFRFGYQYRVFLENNNVVFTEADDGISNVSDITYQPSDTKNS